MPALGREETSERLKIDIRKLTPEQLDALAKKLFALIKREARRERERQSGR